MANYKGVGFDNTNGRVRTGTSSDEVQFAAQITAQDALSVTGGTTTDQLSVTGDASVGGSLTVTGDIVSRGSVNLVVQDNFIDLNFANSTTVAEAGGLTVQMNRNSAFTAGTVTTFVAGVASTSNPTFTYTDATGSSLLAAGDVVVIDNAADSENNGLYVVSAVNQASFPQVVTIKGIGTAAVNAATPWAQNQFTAASGNTATAFKTDLFVQLVADGTAAFTDSGGSTYSKGTFLTAFHANATETSFSNDGGYTTVESTLQSAYNGGNTITTAGTSPVSITLGADAAGFAIEGNSAGDGIVSIGGATAVHSIALNASGAASSITATNQTLSLATTGSNELDITSGGALDLNGVAVTVDGSGGVSIGGSGAASDFTSAGQNLTLETTTSGTLKVASAGLLDLDAGANLDIDVTGTFDMLSTGVFSIDGTGASNVTATSGNLTLSTATSGDVDILSVADVDIDGVNIQADATAALSLQGATDSDLTLAANVASTQTLTIAASNAEGSNIANIDIDADGAITADAGGALSLQGGAASDVTATAGELTLTASNAAGGVSIFAGTGGVDVDCTAAGDGSGDGAFTVNAAAASTIDTSIGELTLSASNAAGGISLFGGTGGVDIDITAAGDGSGNGALTVNAGAASTIDVAGANLTFTTTTSGDIQAQSAGNIKLAAEGASASAQLYSTQPQLVRLFQSADANLAAGDCVVFVNNGGSARVSRAFADTVATAQFVGVSLDTAGVGADADIVLSGIVNITSDDTFNGANHIGKSVYLSATSNNNGQITVTPPSGTADVIFQVGICVGGTGTNWSVLLQPQFIMEIG